MQNPKPQVFYLAGPTGVGKSAMALLLAKRLGAEIIGADAFQIYEKIPILTAQPSVEDRRSVPHHLVGTVPVIEAFDAQRYAKLARTILNELHTLRRTALVVGGSGLYFRALIDGFAPTPAINQNLRVELEKMDLPALIQRLRRSDPEALTKIDVNNKRRVTRAIEIVETSGEPLAMFRTTARTTVPGILFVRDRAELRQRIESNVQRMFQQGVVEEIQALGDNVGPTAARAIGLREIQALLRGNLTLAECKAKIITVTQQYAKRQLTWFRNQTTFQMLNLTNTQQPLVDIALNVFDLK